MSKEHRITIVNEQDQVPITVKHRKLLRQAVKMTLQAEGWTEPVELSLLFISTEAMHEMNYEYRGIDRPTDVLSFAVNDQVSLEEEDFEFVLPSDLSHRLLGDIIIAAPVAEAQAKALGHSLERELVFLTVHGLLHLLGYDHLDETDEDAQNDLEINDLGLEEMVALQEQVLNALGLERERDYV